MRGRVAIISILMGLVLAGRAEGDASRGFDFVVIDGVKIRFGDTIEVSGPAPGSDFFWLTRATTRLRVERINGRANQDEFFAYLFLTNRRDQASHERLKALERGSSPCKIRGRLVSAQLIGPNPVLSIQVATAQTTEPKPVGFADFLDRAARLEGVAARRTRLSTDRESARLTASRSGPSLRPGRNLPFEV